MKKIILSLFLVQITLLAFAQNSYYTKNGSALYGANVIEGDDLTNSKYCQVKTGENIKRYTAYEVSDYGFKNGREYISKEIRLKDSTVKVFVERVLEGNTSLYYYKGERIKLFFLENDSNDFIEIAKKDFLTKKVIFREQLQKITDDCPNVKDAAKLVKYQKKSLNKYISRYNKCVLKPFPHFKYGLMLGYSSSKLIYNDAIDNEYLELFDYKTDKDLTIGLFIDKPISVSDFSFHLELYLTKHGYSYNKHSETTDVDFVVNTTSLNLPILIRYTIPVNIIRPFVNLGCLFSYNMRNESKLYRAFIKQNTIRIDDLSESSFTAKNQIGFSLGGGIDFKLSNKNSLFIEARYSRLNGLSNINSFIKSEVLLCIGINI